MAKKTKVENKVTRSIKEFEEGKLHSGSKKGPVVTNKKQAIAIGYSEAEKEEAKMMYSNIPTILAQQDFNNRHADMLASARGEVKPFVSVEELTFTIRCRPEWLINIPDIKFYEESGEISKDAYDGISMRKITEYRLFSDV